MKVLSMIVLSMILIGGLVGCGKTVAELRTNGDAIVDNGTNTVVQTVGIVSTIIKKVIGAGIAVYDIGKKVVEDTKDNAITVKDTVTGVVAGK